jgi:ubiquinone/menaquinone biosynthesis C-methylase UbiE
MDLKQTYEIKEIHESWEDVYRSNPFQDRLNEALLRRFLKLLRPPPGAQLLDAGCGVGYHTLAFARHGLRCTGVDISAGILEEAGRNAARAGLNGRVAFRNQPLERLDFPSGTFDVVHCRGVLMHIPEWEKALAELCRVLKPGGKIVLLEANTAALEARLVRLLRRLRKARSRVVATPGGLEFWSEKDGQPFVVRVADLTYLTGRLKRLGVRPLHRIATEFWDIYRFPAGVCRNAVIGFNRLWFALGLPAAWSMGNAVLGEKEGAS